MLRMIALFALLISIACVQEDNALTHNDDPRYDHESPLFTIADSVRPTTVAPAKNYHDKLGVNFTWAADSRISGDPTFASQSFKHVRYFQMMEKDFGGATPATGQLAACTNLENPWACPERSMRQHLVRVTSLRAMFPDGYVWIAPEVINGKGWPCKGYTVAELGADPEEAGFQWAQAALATYGPLGNIILAMTNEEWCAEANRPEAYNAWRRGIIRAHRQNPSCQLALGATHTRTRMWNGERMPDNVGDVAPDVWQYLNEIGAWADYHAHGIVDGNFLPHAQAHTAEDYADFFTWNDWVEANYPNIHTAVGEIAYTTSPSGVVATPAQKLADWPTYRKLIEGVAAKADLVFLYQIQDHAYPEGAFSGSGIFPELKAEVEALGRTPIR